MSKYVLFWLSELSSLYIFTSTVINARSIGENCLVGQNVTIGSCNLKESVLGNNINVWAHAVVLGDICVGDHSEIGAGAVVVISVPEQGVVVPESSLVIRQNGQKVKIKM